MEHLNFRKWLTEQESVDEGIKDRFVAGIKGLGRRLGSAASDLGSSPVDALKGVGQVAVGGGQAALGGTQAFGNKNFAKDQASKGGSKILSGIGNVGKGIGKFLRSGAKLAGAIPGAIYDAGKQAGQEMPSEPPPLPSLPASPQRKVVKMNHKDMFDLFKQEASGPNKYGKKAKKIYDTFRKHGYEIDAEGDKLVLITPKGERLY